MTHQQNLTNTAVQVFRMLNPDFVSGQKLTDEDIEGMLNPEHFRVAEWVLGEKAQLSRHLSCSKLFLKAKGLIK